MKGKAHFTHYGYYPLFGFNIPIYVSKTGDELEGRNWIYEQLLTLSVWIDFEFGEGFCFYRGKRIEE